MAQIAFKGSPVHTSGTLPQTSSAAPDFVLTTGDLSDVSLKDYAGKRKILNIVPSLDTGVCAASAVRFNKEIDKIDNAVVLTVSEDLPFAQSRFCESNGVDKVVTLSQLRNKDFGKAYGVEMVDGPLAGLLSRAVVVIDENDNVIYTQQVPEITQEPDYDEVLKAL